MGTWVQVLFHSPYRRAFHLSLTVLVHYRSSRVLSLGGWSPLLPTGFLGSRGTQASSGRLGVSHTGLAPSSVCRSNTSATLCAFPDAGPTTPHHLTVVWFGLLRFRSPLLTESRLIFVPRGTEMFQFPRSPSSRLWIQRAIRGHAATWVAPFGLIRLIACSQLPGYVSARSPSFFGP